MKVSVISQSLREGSLLSNKEIEAFARSCIKDLNKNLKRIIPDISIIFVSREKIRSLNLKYRNINDYTDVLSFESEEDGYLGDIILSAEVIKSYSKEFNVPFSEELKRDILHGIMHLLGFNHTGKLDIKNPEPMFKLQEEILSKNI